MLLDKNGQASAELIFVTVIFLVIAAGMIQLTGSEMNKADTGSIAQVRMIGESVAETINTVYINGNGYSINLTMPNKTFDYTAYVSGAGNISMEYNNQNITIKLIPVNSTEPVTISPGQSYIVKNVNGTITFTQS
ncbi:MULTISPECIES: hypothetical protein [Methanobacterium]|uniref:Class III signal peptide-containing protein n=1 Tax=Methanobacterium bryantii TaxID=2161 RepID=A0A2A2H7T8_METBR|nr:MULTISPECIES: hypothetical protein [Methanobacterium]OEC84877.1 hypothetical protein A9507_14550 [Methanobacterium sp. A39]PAV05531.1 hypothetical protein ASJ80_09145 [Methanobacterium bryantii]